MTDEDIESVQVRIKMLVEKLGGNSPRLSSVRNLYELFHKCREPGSFGLLSAAVTEAEESLPSEGR
jgi:hypothetical protein